MILLRSIFAVVVCVSIGTSILASEETDDIMQLLKQGGGGFNWSTVNCNQQKEHTVVVELGKTDSHSKEVKLSSFCSSCQGIVENLNKLCQSCRQPEANELLGMIKNLALDEEFFKSAFGISDECNLHLGTDGKGNPCPIITIQSIRHYGKIIEAFNKIASNNIGKQLLARILIEIMRQDKQGKSCEEFSYSMASNLNEFERREVCSLCINADTTMSTENVRFEFQFEIGSSPSINIQDIGTGTDDLERSSALFHEMLHWYHLLRCKYRYASEHAVQDSYIDNFMYRLKNDIFAISRLKQYFSGQAIGVVNFEEMRTIIGAHPHGSDYMKPCVIDKNFYWLGFLNGDELSENLYRKSWQLDLRTAHTSIVDRNPDMINILLQLYP